MKMKLLISPLAQSAYFKEFRQVAAQEFQIKFPQKCVEWEQFGALHFMNVDLSENDIDVVSRLSCIQGIFKSDGDGRLLPLSPEPGYILPSALVDGWKYQGKTNELVTQLAINVALHFCESGRMSKSLLDPMAGKGTTLLWGMRYGLRCTGIEQDPGALAALESHLKKQAKLHRLRHRLTKGTLGAKARGGKNRFLLFEPLAPPECPSLKLITGDTRETTSLLGGQRDDVIVSDLPYGVQFKGHTRRNPVDVIKKSARGWIDSLRAGGVMVLVFNTYQPGREQLTQLFASMNCRIHDVIVPHRMSESIVRDLLVVQPNTGCNS